MIELWAAVVGVLLTFFITALIAHGASKAKSVESDRRLNEMRGEVEKLRDKFDSYVSHSHLNEVMSAMRENYRDLKADVNKVLELLSSK